MQDKPDPVALLAELEAGLKAGVAPGLQQRIAANAAALARRDLALAGAFDAAESDRLVALVGRTGSLDDLNRELAEAIGSRRMGLDDPNLVRHLWQTTIEKMRVDQPAYPAFAAWLKATQQDKGNA